jgi:hypothetical protein
MLGDLAAQAAASGYAEADVLCPATRVVQRLTNAGSAEMSTSKRPMAFPDAVAAQARLWTGYREGPATRMCSRAAWAG